MRKAISGFEDLFFLCAAFATLLLSVATFALRNHLHSHNTRVQYGIAHLPAALFAVFLFIGLVGLLRAVLARSTSLADWPVSYYLGGLIAVFSLCWLPVLLAGGFVQDDWMLLAAASIRKILYLHPAYSWDTLDSVDGNFRPLGTVLYFGYMLKAFGLSPHAFLTGNFLINLLGALVAFFLVREMGYSKVTGAAASLLYMTRGEIYTIISWASALGDGIVILLCGLMALAILKANKSHGGGAVGYHLLAWGCFFLATLAKQSSFAAPLIVALLLFLRPGESVIGAWTQRLASAAAGLLVYSGTAAITFVHARNLLEAKSPYPIEFSMDSLLRTFSYAIWYGMTFEFPDKYVTASMLPRWVGLGVVLGVIFLLRKVPRLLGDRPRDVLFALLAGVASVSLFVVLGTRNAPYYGSMAAFWISIALAIALTRFGVPRADNLPARICCFVFCVLVAFGFSDIRLKQTALLPSGGYIWGTFGADRERTAYAELQELLAANPQKKMLVLADFPGPSFYSSMALMSKMQVTRILVYDSSAKAYFANDLQGYRPKDEFSALNDVQAYNWTTPVDATEAAKMISEGQAMWLTFRDDKVVPLTLQERAVP